MFLSVKKYLLNLFAQSFPHRFDGNAELCVTAERICKLNGQGKINIIRPLRERYRGINTVQGAVPGKQISRIQTVCRFFKNAVGKTVTKYINEYRVEKSTALLTTTDASIAEIAAEVGFEDPNYFSRVFRSVMGMSPVEYRNSAE